MRVLAKLSQVLSFALVVSLTTTHSANPQLLKPKDEVEVEYKPEIDWSGFSSYDWSEHQGPGNAPKMANHIRITRAIQREFEARGIEPDAVKPSLLVMYQLDRGKEVKGTSTYGTTVDPTNQRTNINIEQVEVGDLKITIFDGETHGTIWEASMKQELLTPDKAEKQINETVARLFDKLPVKKTKE